MTERTAGHLQAIHITPAAGAPMLAVDRAEARFGGGLVGDRYDTGRGHWSPIRRAGQGLTLIEAEVLDGLAATDGFALAPGDTRRNLTTRGIDLDAAIGRRMRIGPVVVRVIRRCEPCGYLEGLLGLQILDHLIHRGGVRVEIETGGIMTIGDRVTLLDGDERPQASSGSAGKRVVDRDVEADVDRDRDQ